MSATFDLETAVLDILYQKCLERPLWVTESEVFWSIPNTSITEREVREMLEQLVYHRRILKQVGKYQISKTEFLSIKERLEGVNERREEEQVTVMETLGKGKLTISFTETDQPAEWYETSFSGVWVGNYYNQRDDVMVYSIEVCRYPLVAGAFDEDIEEGIADLQHWIEAADL